MKHKSTNFNKLFLWALHIFILLCFCIEYISNTSNDIKSYTIGTWGVVGLFIFFCTSIWFLGYSFLYAVKILKNKKYPLDGFAFMNSKKSYYGEKAVYFAISIIAIDMILSYKFINIFMAARLLIK